MLRDIPSHVTKAGWASGTRLLLCASFAPPGLFLWQGCRWYRFAVTFYIVFSNCGSWWWDGSMYSCIDFFFPRLSSFFTRGEKANMLWSCTIYLHNIRPLLRCTAISKLLYNIPWYIFKFFMWLVFQSNKKKWSSRNEPCVCATAIGRMLAWEDATNLGHF